MELALPTRLRRRSPLLALRPVRSSRRNLLIATLGTLIGGLLLWILVGESAGPHRPAPPPRPVAVLSAGGASTVVTAAGAVLGPAHASAPLPVIPVIREPAAGAKVLNGTLRSYLAVLGAAPVPLLHLVARIYDGAEGLTVKMVNGLLAYFGNSARPHAKWDSFAAVIGSSAAAGASYIDLRLPERPTVGMPAGPESAAGTPAGAAASNPTTATELEESLSKALHGERPIGAEGEEPPPPSPGLQAEKAEVSTPESAVPSG